MSEITVYEQLIGKSFKSVTESVDQFIFEDYDGNKYEFYHSQGCCESVTIEDICGDLSDLVGSPLLEAEEVITYGSDEYESSTHTWYKFSTIKGCVSVRWIGESNGYYSESVDFREIRVQNHG